MPVYCPTRPRWCTRSSPSCVRCATSGSQPDRQRLELVGEPRLDIPRGAGYLHVGEPRERLLDQDPQLQARQGGPQAEVPATGTERLVLGVAGHVEAVGVLMTRLVAIAGGVPHHELLALADALPVQLGVVGRGACEVAKAGNMRSASSTALATS